MKPTRGNVQHISLYGDLFANLYMYGGILAEECQS